MSEIRATINQLHSKAEELKQYSESFKNIVNSLDETEMALMSMWDGEAKTAFHNAFSRDKKNMEDFYNLVGRFACSLEQIAAKYEQAEAQSTALVDQNSGASPFIGHINPGFHTPINNLRYGAPPNFWNRLYASDYITSSTNSHAQFINNALGDI